MNKELFTELNLQPHYSVEDSIPIRRLTHSGLMETRKGNYCKTYRLHDINFITAAKAEKGDIFLKYEEVLNNLEPSQMMQITVFNHRIDTAYMEDEVFYREVGDELDYLRNAANDIIRENIIADKDNYQKDKYITLAIDSYDISTAEQEFQGVEADFREAIEEIEGCSLTALTANEKIRLLHNIYNMQGNMENYSSNIYFCRKKITSGMQNIYEQGGSVKELVQPPALRIENGYIDLGTSVARAFDLTKLRSVIDVEALHKLSNANFDLLITLNIRQIDPDHAAELVENELANAEGDIYEVQKKLAQKGASISLVPYRLEMRRQQAHDLNDDLQHRDQRFFNVKMHAVILADTTENLETYSQNFLKNANRRGMTFREAGEFRENSFLSTLPYGYDCTALYRTLTTEATAAFLPFGAQEMIQRGGDYLGRNKNTRNVITHDIMSGDSYGTLILGETGKGKSLKAKDIIGGRRLRNEYREMLIIDPNGEWGSLTKSLGGQEIIMTAGGRHHINPWDIDTAYGENPIAEKEGFLLSFCTEMLGYPITPTQKAAIAVITKKIYQDWKKLRTKESVPTLNDFYNELLAMFVGEHRNQDMYDLINAVKYYIEGECTMFQGKTNIDINNSIVSFNLLKLGEDMHPLSMLVVCDTIWNRICRNRELGIPTDVVIDEIHLMFGRPETALWMKKYWKMLRKFLGCPCGITQNTDELLASEAGRAVLKNSSMVIMLSLAKDDRDVIGAELGLTKSELGYITNKKAGEGLLYIAPSKEHTVKTVVPFENPMPEDNAFYQLIHTTNKKKRAVS